MVLVKAISPFAGDIDALANRLRALSIGETITYSELDKVLGRPVLKQRYLLLRARARVEREDGALFATVFNVGVRRLPVQAFSTLGYQARSKIRRGARAASKRMAAGLEKANDVPAETMRAVAREQSVLGLIQFAARDRTVAKMLDDVPITSPTPVAQAAKFLMEALGVKMPETS
jgi:hypothetical protein